MNMIYNIKYISLITCALFFYNTYGMLDEKLTLYAEAKHSYENNQFKPYFVLSSYEKKRNIITVAGEHKSGLLTASCAQLFFPRDVNTKIAEHLIKTIALEYRCKLLKNRINFPLSPLHFNDTWQDLHHYDGTYDVLPVIENKCILWDNTENIQYHKFINTFGYWTKHLSKNDYSVIGEFDDKRKYQIITPHDKQEITSMHPIEHLLFSNDCTLLAIGNNDTQDNVTLINTKTFKRKTSSLDGPITALCAAHHSPLFAAGSNKNLALITKKNTTFLSGHEYPIISLEFSLDDTKLISCSYAGDNHSHLILWDTSNSDNPKQQNNVLFTNTIEKAFFIHNGETIVIRKTNGSLYLLDSATGNSQTLVDNGNKDSNDIQNCSATTWSCCIPLLFILEVPFKKINIIKTTSGEIINSFKFLGNDTFFTGIGMTQNETSLLLMTKTNNRAKEDVTMHELELFNYQETKNIAFIEKKANIVQLSELWNLLNKNISIDATQKYLKISK